MAQFLIHIIMVNLALREERWPSRSLKSKQIEKDVWRRDILRNNNEKIYICNKILQIREADVPFLHYLRGYCTPTPK